MAEIKFSYNWNNKLGCKAFTTIRLSSNKYEIGQDYDIFLKGIQMGTAKAVEIRQMKLKDINEYISRLDTGYSAEDCQKLLTDMYKNKNIDWEEQWLDFVLLVYIQVQRDS